MPRASLVPLALQLLAACPGDTATTTDATTATTTAATTTPATTTTVPTTTTAPQLCIPGQSQPCECAGGATGAMICTPEGTGFDPCQCDDPTTTTTTTTTTTDPNTTALTLTTTTEPDATTTTDTTTGIPAGPCMEVVTLELFPADAELSGDWQLTMSNLGEGQVASLIDPAADHEGAVRYTVDLPCDALWTIWVRVLDQAGNDAYQVTLDDQPDPPAIFEGDCQNAGNSYKWARLNWRDPQADPCKYLQNPWTPMWTSGNHTIEFRWHESPALGRILLTTNPNLVPK